MDGCVDPASSIGSVSYNRVVRSGSSIAAVMLDRLARAQRVEVLRACCRKADRALAAAWWAVLVLRGVLPACSRSRWACSSAPSQRGDGLAGAARARRRRLRPAPGPDADPPGDRRQPRRPHRGLALRPADRRVRRARRAWATSRTRSSPSDLTVARDFDLGMTGPPLSISMDFIAGGLVEMIGGLASARRAGRLRVVGAARARRRVARDALAAARERGLARPQHRRGARRAARRRLRVPARRRSAGGEGAAPVRARRLDDRPLRRTAARACTSCSTRRRGCASGRCCGACCSCSAPTSSCSGRSANARGRRQPRARRSWSIFAQAAVGAVDDRVRRAQLGARRRGGAGRRGAAPRAGDGARGRARRGRPAAAGGMPAREIRFRDVTLRLSRRRRRCSSDFDLTIPAGSSLAIVGQNGAGKTTLAKLLCRLYDPQAGAIEVDGVDLRDARPRRRGASRVTAVFQDFIRFELPLRDNVAPGRRARRRDRARRSPTAGAASLADARHGAGARLRRAAPTSRAGSGSASRWRARCAPCGSAPASCCSTSRPRSSTCAARRRSSSASSPRRGTARRS